MPAYRQSHCDVEGCHRAHKGHGLCPTHLRRKRLGRDLYAPVEVRTPGKLCSYPKCEEKHSANGYCSLHEARNRRGKDMDAPRRGSLSPVWRTMPGRTQQGYVREWRTVEVGKTEYRFQHRGVMEEMLGRPLVKHENVHHINGVRDDNRPENLELWVTKQPPGQRPEDKASWAREILGMYGTDEERAQYGSVV